MKITTQGNNSIKKETDNSQAYKLKGTEYCDLSDKEFKTAVVRNSVSHMKTQKDNSMNSGIKYMN